MVTNEICCKQLRLVLTNRPFVVFALSVMLILSTSNSIRTILIDFFVSKGIDRDTELWVYLGLTIVNSIIRLITGCLAQMKRISKIVGAVSLLIFPFARTVVQCAVLACLFGISFGGVVSTLSIASLHLLGENDYSIGLGMVLTLAEISSTVTGPVAGTSPLVLLNICSYFFGNIFSLLEMQKYIILMLESRFMLYTDRVE